MKVLITGCGRSGTAYAAKVLSAAGLACRHELAFDCWRQGMWDGYEAESSWLALPAIERGMVRDCLIIHLTRNPLHVIRSWMGLKWLHDFTSPHLAFMSGAEPSIYAITDPLERCQRYWFAWNRRIENHTGFRIRVEEFNQPMLEQIAEISGHKLKTDVKVGRFHIGDPDNTITWQDAITPEIAETAARYGYHPPEEKQ